ncbi:MAG: glycosyltransferase [Akkermansiaceae bacterium]
MSTKQLHLSEKSPRLKVDGKFFQAGGRRVFLKMVTYGPFPDDVPDSRSSHSVELERVAAAGFNAIRIYTAPSDALLAVAEDCGLWVFVGLEWSSGFDFIGKPSLYSAARVSLSESLRKWGSYPALAGVFVGNEIPADMVRWMGAVKVRHALESLIDLGREICPELLFAYANFPTTEYLELENADFTAMNVYLERQEDFASYLPRLHNVAGDRPVVISEFGLDTQRNTEQAQAESLLWFVQSCLESGMAGMTAYAWSDLWFNGGRLVDDWSFGMTRRDGSEKPAYNALAEVLPNIKVPEHALMAKASPRFSVVVCTHNGERHIEACLRALGKLDYSNYEMIVVNDGSSDSTEEIVRKYPEVRLINLQHAGLSAARNRGAEEASGDIIAYTDDDCEPDAGWLSWLASSFQTNNWDACGGPNLPPLPRCSDGNDKGRAVDEAVVASAPGAPSHVLLSDQEAEHIPGCNLVVKKAVLEQIGGFNPIYRVAGDDVDFCWRLIDAGFHIGFSGAAFVWHRRRTTIWRYFKQQLGYGKAEALLMREHPHKFKRGCGASWKGQVYAGGALSVDVGSVIYHGAMGSAPYQQLALTMQPQRPLARGFDTLEARLKLFLAQTFQPWLRKYARWRHSLKWRKQVPRNVGPRQRGAENNQSLETHESHWWSDQFISREDVLEALQEDAWEALNDYSHWDMAQQGTRIIIACEHHAKGVLLLVRLGSEQSPQTSDQLTKCLNELGFLKTVS